MSYFNKFILAIPMFYLFQQISYFQIIMFPFYICMSCSVQTWIHRKLSDTTCPVAIGDGQLPVVPLYIVTPAIRYKNCIQVIGKYHCHTRTIWLLCSPSLENHDSSNNHGWAHWHLSLICGKCFHVLPLYNILILF